MCESEDTALINNIFNFSRVYHTLFGEMLNRIDDENSRAGIRILFILKKQGPLPISQIAEKMRIARPNMTLIIDGLTKKNFVKRCNSGEDRRIINVEVTDEGNSYIERIIAKRDKVIKEIISILEDREKSEVYNALDVLIRTGEKILNS